MIHEFCEGYENIRDQKKDDEAKRIYEYINEHFMEYDISIEKVAENMNTSTDTVRQEVLILREKHDRICLKGYV